MERTKDRNQRKSKGKRDIEAVYQTAEPSQKEDHQTLSERLAYLKEQAAATKKKRKGKQSMDEDTSPQHVRRSSRLKGKLKTVKTKRLHFIDLGEETPEKPLETSPDHSPHHTSISQPNVDMSPSRPEFEISPSQQDFGVSPRKATPEVDPN